MPAAWPAGNPWTRQPKEAPLADDVGLADDPLVHHGIPTIAPPMPEGAGTVVARLARWMWADVLSHLDRFRVSKECGQIVIVIPVAYGRPTADVRIDSTYSARRPMGDR